VLYLRATTALVLPAIVDGAVPVVVLRSSGAGIDRAASLLLGVPLVLCGLWLLLDSVFMRFAHEGRGTLAPIDPPRFVVRGGAYRIVRNPMYVANVAIIVGLGAVFRSWSLLTWAVVVLVAFQLFVVTYEEPTLGRRFGEDYDDYRRDVGRWIPHRRDRAGRRRSERP
jgi:protein-S-isoprenylcysteine O-methyltransferase Ste14